LNSHEREKIKNKKIKNKKIETFFTKNVIRQIPNKQERYVSASKATVPEDY
jgi:hypothetical protein